MGVQQRMDKYLKNRIATSNRIYDDYRKFITGEILDWGEYGQFERQHRLYGRMRRYQDKMDRLTRRGHRLKPGILRVRNFWIPTAATIMDEIAVMPAIISYSYGVDPGY